MQFVLDVLAWIWDNPLLMKLTQMNQPVTRTFLVALLFLATTLAAARTEAGALPDLTGIVSARDNTPIKDATVFIYSAGPKEGRGTL